MRIHELQEERASLKPVADPELSVGEASFGGSDPSPQKEKEEPAIKINSK